MSHPRTLARFCLAGLLLLMAATSTSAVAPAANSADPLLPLAGSAQLTAEPPVDQIIVKYRAAADVSGLNAPDQPLRLKALSDAAGVALTYFRPMSGDAHVLRLPAAMPVADVESIAQRIMTLPDVEYAEPDRILQALLTPNDTQYGSQWHYFETYGINAPAAWNITTGSTSVVVAVIDTGYLDHADLSGRFVQGYDFISNSFTANDGGGRDTDAHDPGDWITANQCFPGSPTLNSSWHGTHVAGTIGANSNNALGVAGVNWNARILPARVLGKCGGTTSDIADAIRWSAGLAETGVPNNLNPADVINMSLGGSGSCGSTTQTAINDAIAAGTTVVVAAGNSNLNASGFTPANCNGVVTIAATDRGGDKASYSNYGSVVEVSAPGGETAISTNGVLSTLNAGTTVPGADSYVFYQGTSMAAPHAAGVASLLYSLSPSLTPAQVSRILTGTITAFPGGSACNTSICGTGIVNAYNAVNALPRISGTYPVTSSVNTTFTLVVSGANFIAASTVKWNGVNLTTTFVSSSQVTATVKSSNVITAGTYNVAVSGNHPTYGSLTTAARPFTVGTVRYVYLPVVLKNQSAPPPPTGPTPGFWESTTGDEFYVTPDSAYVDNFAIYISVTGCGSYKITHVVPEPIVNDQFSFTGSFYASGTFNSDTSASGTDGLNSFNIPGCGFVSGGPWDWTATWQNSSQPSVVPATVVGPDGVQRATTIRLYRSADLATPNE